MTINKITPTEDQNYWLKSSGTTSLYKLIDIQQKFPTFKANKYISINL